MVMMLIVTIVMVVVIVVVKVVVMALHQVDILLLIPGVQFYYIQNES